MAENKKQSYDVIVIGSGASGGWACKRLSEAGLKVALLEAGRAQSDQNFSEHKPEFELRYRNMAPEIVRKTRPIQSKFDVCNEYTYDWFANDLEEPYTTPAGKRFDWMGRLRITGGRTNVWGRVSLRFSDLDFKSASFDGFGEDWPLGYKDIEPYYDLVEKYVGITGSAEGLEHLPDNQFQPPVPLTCQETLFRNRVKEKLGRVVMPTRSANLTKPLNGRGPCHYCGPCERGCMTHSYFNSAFTTVADALATGNCTLVSNAMAYKVLMDGDRNRARGVLYIDRNTRQAREVYARAVVLCAQSQESVRILLNSATPQYSNGLANSSGVLGHFLTAHVRSGGGRGELPSFDVKPSVQGGGPHKPLGIYVARFRNLPKTPPYKKFLRGYGYEGECSTDFNWEAPGFGDAYKKALLEPRSTMEITGFGEVLPRWENFVELDSTVKDIYGIPVLKIHMSDGENERAMIQDMGDSAGEMLEAAGAKNIRTYAHPSAPRWALHEAGIARMGSDPKTSVLNQFQQAHDIQNLFVMDASGFTSNPCQNPTLTIMALCVRSCDYLMAEMKRGAI
ncbi:MAG TPA: GMC family oxidoreductase [Candidatus Angelobacter sp.]|nr:GMC family oxidoreductase [Candidatus Angelobacter sp.]